jgi:hypothetical protein
MKVERWALLADSYLSRFMLSWGIIKTLLATPLEALLF